ncbi:hypothetical protein HY485_00085 [Candidatus Woesearchaeota archaeon]|nr:hypothetical protein [Candidatus Woesearchaeota archaeon]
MLKDFRCELKDVAFLAGLNARLHHVEKCQHDKDVIDVDQFTDKQMSVNELEKVVERVKSDGLVLLPASLNFGCGLGFRVYWQHGREKMHVEEVLCFKESQLPVGYDFERLSSVFLSRENIVLCHIFGLPEPEEDRKMYE